MSGISYTVNPAVAIRNLFDRNMERSAIASILDLPEGYVGKVIGGYKSSMRKKQVAEERAAVMLKLRNEGMTNQEISKVLCTTSKTVVYNIGKQPKELVHVSMVIAAQKRKLNRASRALRQAAMLNQAAINAEVNSFIAD